MTAAAIVRSALEAGVRVRIDGDRLVLSAANRPDDRLLENLRREKTGIVEYLRDLACWTEEDWQALFDERAALMEFDGGLTRLEAEGLTREEIARVRRLVPESPNA